MEPRLALRPLSAVALMLLIGILPLAAQQSADSAHATAAFEPGRIIERPMSAGEVHAYAVHLESGWFLHAVAEQIGVNIALAVYGPDGGKLVEVDTIANYDAPEWLEIEATEPGAHRLELLQRGPRAEGRYQLRVEVRTAGEQAAWLAERRAEAEAARAWIREAAVPLATVEAGHGFADLEPVRQIVGDARIVALGEATHGTRDFFQLKHRMLEFLVSELGFDIFAIEATLPEAVDVDRYVLTGEGDPARALAGMYFWVWDTEEVLEMIHWMRRYNQDPRHTRKVRFYGFDMQYGARAARITLEYLRRVDAPAAERASAALEPLVDPFLERDVGSRWPRERREALLASIRELAAGFDQRRDEYAAVTSAADFDLARRHLHVLEQAMHLHAAPSFEARDSAMAANVAWMLDRNGSGSKAVLWAHNLHVATYTGSMGWYLRRQFGDDLRIFGFSFDEGGFQARDGEMQGALHAFRVGTAPECSLDRQLAAAGLELAALDLRRLPGTGPVADWFEAPRAQRYVGSGYLARNASMFFVRGRVASSYDALFFVRETSAARPNPTGRRPAPAPPANAPVNADFEAGEPGDWPPGWERAQGIAGIEWEAVLTREDARQGRQSVVIRRAEGGGYGETFGQLQQRIDATPWRGQRVTLRASVRVEAATPADRAYLWLEVTRPQGAGRQRVFYENMAERPITSSDWREYEITADVPEGAGVIAYGIAVVGAGRVWLDEVHLR